MEYSFIFWIAILVGSILFNFFILTKKKNNADSVEEEFEFEENHLRRKNKEENK